MNVGDPWSGWEKRAGLLIATGLLVLYIVGSVNRDRIRSFKRTESYSETDYQLLLRVLACFEPHLYTLAHVAAEVSNLTDLRGPERLQACHMLREALGILKEPTMESVRAAQREPYESLGLTDAPIAALARESGCAVLTDDLDLYLALTRKGFRVIHFTHLRARKWGV